jgi:hypothetical protein
MIQRAGEKELKHLFEPVKWLGLEVKNRIKYGACCVSNYNTRDGFITPRELARTAYITGTVDQTSSSSREARLRTRNESRETRAERIVSMPMTVWR